MQIMEKRMTNPKSEGYISAKDMAGRAAYYKVLQAAKNGELTRIKRGVYATDDHLASQMLDVEKVVPGGVLCLYSAWSHYQLTTPTASQAGTLPHCILSSIVPIPRLAPAPCYV
jgi:predicted transcriptional regulator of viral defense system